MKKFVLSGLCCAGLMFLFAEQGHAHGGQYRGPGDVVPPGGGGGGGGSSGGPSGPTTGGPSGPSAPAPTGPTTGGGGPSTGGPSGPGGGAGGPKTGGRGSQLDDDLTEWTFWWEFNKDPFIRLKDAVQSGGTVTGSDDFYLGNRRSEAKNSLRPTEEQITGEILPALKKAIDSTDQRDMTSSCMVAMAKIGKDHPDFSLISVFKPRLKRPDQEIRETAALSIGIAAIASDKEKELQLLTGLALDNDDGRKEAGGGVDNRTRSFACYGLGLIAYRHDNVELKSSVLQTMKQLLTDKKIGDRNIKVAAINAISLLNIGSSSDALMAEALKTLEDYYMQSLGAGEQLIQAHCPPAIAKLLGRDGGDVSERFKTLFADDLQGKGKVKRSSDQIYQSCVVALGQMVSPNDEKDEKKNPDAKYSKLLLDTFHDHKDVQTRNFAALALGQVGGKLNRDTLLIEFKRAKAIEKPWCALGLGVYAFNRAEHAKNNNITPEPETTISEYLLDAIKSEKNPSVIGALGISLGLSQAKDAADFMRDLMLSSIAKETMCGYLCIGLALMNDTRSTESIRGLLPQSVRRYDLLPQAAIALGKLGDKTVAEELQKLMTDGEPNLAKLSAIASALGFIGDSRTISPLKKMLFDEKLGFLSRAFAAVALGGIADKESLPWNSKIGTNINYRASVETLTNQNTGILDIL
ncbi:MAG: HEAT repeat domain-containing protein [Planctomycetes bacterium]|nr:HEAT repeat domain-containing protein [Planctomycetota bacterium]